MTDLISSPTEREAKFLFHSTVASPLLPVPKVFGDLISILADASGFYKTYSMQLIDADDTASEWHKANV